MKAVILTMRGLCAASTKYAYIEEKLGQDQRVRHVAISVRHYLKSRRSHDSDSLITLYMSVMRGLCAASTKYAYIEEKLGQDQRVRHVAISVRHYLKSRRSHDSDSLITLYMSVMRGLCAASTKYAYIEEILGQDQRVRHAAISARHYLKSRRSHDRCTDSLITLYRKVIAQ